ncbi:MAG: hypothetical protein IJ264_08720, partial [Clostridia bacterium]|nr:hypothetical protein [Clostridia bacterium]
ERTNNTCSVKFLKYLLTQKTFLSVLKRETFLFMQLAFKSRCFDLSQNYMLYCLCDFADILRQLSVQNNHLMLFFKNNCVTLEAD